MKLSTAFAAGVLWFFVWAIFSMLGESYFCHADHTCGTGLTFIVGLLCIWLFIITLEEIQ